MRGEVVAAYYLLLSFIIFVIIDYKYISSLLDSTFFYQTSGSKLNYESGNKPKRKSFDVEKYDVIDWGVLLGTCLVIFLILFCISLIPFNINPLNLNIGIKEIDLTYILAEHMLEFKSIYYISMFLFSVIVVWNYKTFILSRVKYWLRSFIGYKESEETYNPNDYIIARDENDECFTLSEKTLYQNMLITGSIGSGKTSGAISWITYRLLKSGKGGLILDVKGNFVNIVETMCKRLGRIKDLKIISKNSNAYFDILDSSLSPLELANRIKQIITLLSTTNVSDPYWLDKVENVILNLFILMKYENTDYEMMKLHKLITDDAYLNKYMGSIKCKVKKEIPKEKEAFELCNAITFIENEFKNLDSRVKSILKSEITRFTIPLITEYDIYNRFCNKEGKEKISFNENQIVVLSLNIAENRALAKIIATCLKLNFQRHVISNISNSNPIFFIADEFQEFCNVEDSHFLSLSREAKCMNIISTQSYSSLNSSLRDKEASRVIIQNLVNKVWFRNDDTYTIEEAIKQLGKVNVIRENKSISETGQESKKYIFKQGFKNTKSSISKTLNYVENKENEFDENFFTRELKTFEALAFISDGESICKPKKIIFERWE